MKYSRSIKLTFCFYMLNLFTTLLAQQKQDTIKQLSLAYSFGPSNSYNKNGNSTLLFGPTIYLIYNNKNILYQFKGAYHADFEIFNSFPQKSFEFDVMIGKVIRVKQNSINISTGLGYTFGKARTNKYEATGLTFGGESNYEGESFKTLCIPFAAFYQLKWFGIGIDANLNSKLPYIGLKANMQLKISK
jgi:hypothetical protein